MKNSILALVLLLIAPTAYAQVAAIEVFGVQTNPKAGPYPLLTLDTLNGVQTLSDIHARYPASWVASYNSVEITSTCKGMTQTAASGHDKLSPEQLKLLKSADFGCKIDVEVDYLPQNSLKDNPPRKMNFSLRVVPIIEAKYSGGFQDLIEYLQENTLDKISASKQEGIELATARFNINTEGQVADVRMITSTGDASSDQLILDALRAMPRWTPAQDAQGKKIVQEFEFRLGTRLLRCDYSY